MNSAVHKRRHPRVVVLDMDSSESPTYGAQEGSAYNGHFGCTCYHPLFVFNQLGDVERCALRSGNVHSADGWRAVLEPVVARYRGTLKRLYFRGDAAFANPEIYEFLEGEGIGYTIRLPANRVLQDGSDTSSSARSGDRRTRCAATSPVSVIGRRAGKSPAGSWPRSNGTPASCTRASASSSPTWRGRPSVWLPSTTSAARRSSTSRKARTRSSGPACHAACSPPMPYVFSSMLAMPRTAEPWSLTSLREKLIKIGAKVVRHGRYVTFHMWTAPSSQGVLQCFDQIACVHMSGLT